ncbi:Crp/Fnr family transcriptional regulator [Kordiimonas sp. SCSIO 12610]|uniref:Crp/Fnr family transcriptional regulator n=1 Tax=Kordiimonas sp. SCSIO 12610 TaxID=2829597 RepID=UPI002109202E|nr:Crp/Fnr family transcriptional regulator [Kordiimonas sp. SCSIO 12610]UTW56337.1 Crp/Fnr family transcriptional regulator [Kordiimonas sp. SCSIO 12610]
MQMHEPNPSARIPSKKTKQTHQDKFKLFFGDNPDLLNAIEEAATVIQIPAKNMILSQDDKGDEVYYLLTGTAYAALVSSDGDEIWLDTFDEGNLFGEMAAFGLGERSASIFAATKVTVASFSAETFKTIIRNFGEVGIKVAELLTGRVKHTTMRMFELTAMSANGRVYAELLRMAKPSVSNQILTIEKMPPKTRIAEKIHSTRETVSRAISDLQQRGIIKIDGKRIQIIAPEQLKELML